MAYARSRRGNGLNYWPGFVDALSTLILSIIFLLTVFVVMQFYLQQDVANKNSALSHLSAQVAYLGQLLSMEKTESAFSPEDRIGALEMQSLGVMDNRELLLHFAKALGRGDEGNPLLGEGSGEK